MVSGKQPTALEEAARKWRLALTEKRKVQLSYCTSDNMHGSDLVAEYTE